MDMPWLKQGITMLGCPFGVDSYVQNVLEQVCNKISDHANDFAQVDDWLIHLQLNKFSTNAMLPYFLRTASPALTRAHVMRVDNLIWNAVLDFSDVPTDEREDPSLHATFQDARCQFLLPILEGCL